MWSSVSRPTTLRDALRELREAAPRTRLVAGGTDLVVEQQRGVRQADHLIDISAIRELRYLRRAGNEVVLGALATHNDVLAARALRSALLPLAQACIEVGAPQIRTRATVAGNLVTASPANDTIAPLIALDASVVLASLDGERTLALEDFYPGFRATALRHDELLREIRFPALGPARRGIFLKLGLRRAQAISVVDIAIVVSFDGERVRDARIVLGALAPTVVRAPEAEGALLGNRLDAATIERAAELALEAIAPIDDVRGSADYRVRTVRALVAEGLERLGTGREAEGFPEAPILLQTDAPIKGPAAPFDGTVVARVNGADRALPTAPRTTLLNALRDVGLTGAKEGCAEGECGACTVWLDGQAVMSCLVPAAQAHGAEIVTIEGLAPDGVLHPLQQRYVDCGAVQCGFCIPGMLMAGAKLLEECPEPALDDQQVAISGNICRCTGYRKILDAMGDTSVGVSLPRADAHDKVTGAALYPADLIEPGMLHAAAVFAHRTHARIRAIRVAGAMALDGVVTVLTAKDVPHNRFGLIEADQPLLCDDVVRFWGDRVALVVARTPELARDGAARVKVEYDDLPAITDPRKAIEPDAQRVHSDRSNVLLHQKIRRGDAEAALAAADVVVEGRFTTGWQEHAYLQPDAGIAYWEGGKLVVETAGQWMHEDRRQIASMFHMREDDVVIRYAKIGGAFGGREDLSLPPLVALAAWKLRVPVAMVWTRDEATVAHHKRHPFFINATWGATRDGRIVAAKTELIADGGAYASTSVEVLKCASTFAIGPYHIENVATDAIVAYTHNVPSGAFRGFGSPQAHFAAESMVTRLAHELGVEPVEIRRRNLYREGDLESTGERLPPGVAARAVFERCLEEKNARFPSTVTPRDSRYRRGVGIACGMKNVGYSFGFPEQATATVALDVAKGELRGARVYVGAAEVGQGAHMILRQIAAETLELPCDAVQMITDDSSVAPNAGSASASRMTLMGGRAVKDACEAARRKWRAGREAKATVQYKPPRTTKLDPQTGHGRPHYCYGYAAQAVEVEVDVRTGVTRVLRVISVHDVGRAINRQLVEGQIEGCLAQALGYALTENFVSSDGKILTPHFSTYLLPTALDMPAEVHPVILETADVNGPFGARGVAEMPLVPFAPAVAAAIFDATGAWVSDLPMTPERVLDAIDATRRATTAAETILV